MTDDNDHSRNTDGQVAADSGRAKEAGWLWQAHSSDMNEALALYSQKDQQEQE